MENQKKLTVIHAPIIISISLTIKFFLFALLVMFLKIVNHFPTGLDFANYHITCFILFCTKSSFVLIRISD